MAAFAVVAAAVLTQPDVGALSWTGQIVTVAGQCGLSTCGGNSGGDGGPARSANLSNPADVAVDASGNLFIADRGGHRIRRVDGTTAVITTIAGNGTAASGGDGGPAGSAQLNGPISIAVDSAGNLYIAESLGHRIRKITAATNIISTMAGTGTAGYGGDLGPATSAQLNTPNGVAIDAAGNVFISDTNNYRVRKVAAADGTIVTIAGIGVNGFSGDGGPAIAAQLSDVRGIEVDTAGNVYVADFNNARVREIIAATGAITTVAGTGVHGSAGDGGLATDAQLSAPTGIAVDATNLYIVEGGTRIRRVNLSNHFIRTVAGGGRVSCRFRECEIPFPATALSLSSLVSVTLDGAGNLFHPAFGGLVQKVIAAPQYITADVPLAADMDADGRADLIVWSVSTGTWKWATAASGFSEAGAQTKQWGNRALGDVPLVGDIDGDGRADLAVWRASTGTWYWLTSSSGYSYAAAGSKQWGNQTLGDVPMLADMDGNGRAELIVWREGTGVWYWLTSGSGYNYAFANARAYGDQAGADVPLLGRFDSDALLDLSVWTTTGNIPFSPKTKAFFAWTSSTGASGLVQWGTRQLGDLPMLAEVDGDGLSDLIVWRPTDGKWYWLRSTTAYDPAQQKFKQWGNSGLADSPLVGDIDGDGLADLLVWRASSRTWYWLTSSSGYSYASAGSAPWS